MKGVSIAIETIVYLILAITVLSVLLFFFLSQAGPAQDQYTLEAQRNRWCGTYVSSDFTCSGRNGQPTGATPDVLNKIGETCSELARRFGFNYDKCTGGSANLNCIRQCCLTCPNKEPI